MPPRSAGAPSGTEKPAPIDVSVALGLAAVVRDSAVAIGLVLGLLYLFPIVSSVVGNPHWQRHLEQFSPMTAGLYVQATVDLKALPLAPGRASPPSPPGPAARSCASRPSPIMHIDACANAYQATPICVPVHIDARRAGSLRMGYTRETMRPHSGDTRVAAAAQKRRS